MKYVYLVTTVFVFINQDLFCQKQPDDYLMKVIDQPYEKFIRIDEHIFYELNKKKKRLYLDNKLIDSTGVKPYYMYIYKGDLLGYFFDLKNYYSIKINLLAKSLSMKSYPLRDSIIIYENLNGELYGADEIYHSDVEKKKYNDGLISEGEYLEKSEHPYGRKIYKLNPYTLEKEKLLFDLDSALSDNKLDLKYHEVDQLFNLGKTNKLLISTTYCLGGCESYNYFIYDKKTGILKHDNKLIQNEPNNEYYNVRFELTDISEDYFIGEYYDRYVKNEDHKGWFIFNSNLDIVTRILPHSYYNRGYNFSRNKVISCNMKSNLDDNKEVIIVYKFSLPLERSFYRIYKNEELIKDDISQCDKYELNLLKNMLFAKYNYKFIDIFYQAYFNMFEFYNSEDKKTTRLTKVDYLFTEIDKKNLKTIETALSKIK